MVSLEHVKLLEDRIIRTLDHVQHVQEENSLLREKLDEYKGRIDELEVLIKTFKDDQSKIEDGILAALDRLNQFEIAVERGISSVNGIASVAATGNTVEADSTVAADSEAIPSETAEADKPEEDADNDIQESAEDDIASDNAHTDDDDKLVDDEISSADEDAGDIELDLADVEDGLPTDSEDRKDSEELDIF